MSLIRTLPKVPGGSGIPLWPLWARTLAASGPLAPVLRRATAAPVRPGQRRLAPAPAITTVVRTYRTTIACPDLVRAGCAAGKERGVALRSVAEAGDGWVCRLVRGGLGGRGRQGRLVRYIRDEPVGKEMEKGRGVGRGGKGGLRGCVGRTGAFPGKIAGSLAWQMCRA